MHGMRTVVLGPRPAELETLIQRRHALGQDLYDEVWEGEYHVAPAAHPSHGYLDNQLAVVLWPLARNAGLVGTGPFNLGESDNFRVPDRGLHRSLPSTTWVPTAAVVVEIVSPDDETWDKLDFYAAHAVDELLIVDGRDCSVTWLVLEDNHYVRAKASVLLGITAEALKAQIDWPPPAPPSL